MCYVKNHVMCNDGGGEDGNSNGISTYDLLHSYLYVDQSLRCECRDKGTLKMWAQVFMLVTGLKWTCKILMKSQVTTDTDTSKDEKEVKEEQDLLTTFKNLPDEENFSFCLSAGMFLRLNKTINVSLKQSIFLCKVGTKNSCYRYRLYIYTLYIDRNYIHIVWQLYSCQMKSMHPCTSLTKPSLGCFRISIPGEGQEFRTVKSETQHIPLLNRTRRQQTH